MFAPSSLADEAQPKRRLGQFRSARASPQPGALAGVERGTMRKLTLLAALIGALTLSPSALAAAPTATTGPASHVTATRATVGGRGSTGKEETTYHFEYGTTTAYGTATPTANAGKGNKTAN